MSKPIKYKNLTSLEKGKIYTLYQSGKFYRKELLTMFSITNATFMKVIEEVSGLVKGV